MGPWSLKPEDPWPLEMVEELKKCFSPGGPEILLTLSGPLGAGKTTRIKQLAQSLGMDSNAFSSPTFLKLMEHRHFGFRVLHMDLYRVEDSAELMRWGLGEESAALTLVEWPDLLLNAWSENPHWHWDQHWRLQLTNDHSGVLSKVSKSFIPSKV
jgi:tRNA threonylcarbamoyl adenosine modification protein YjeE